MNIRRLLSALLLLTLSVAVRASDPADSAGTLRPVYSAYMIKAGGSRVADTYLSPIRYSGWTVGFGYQRLQAMAFAPADWVMQLTADADLADLKNVAGNSTMWDLELSASWTMMRRWQLPKGFSAGVGPCIGVDLGALYLARNGNNPVAAKASIDLGASGYAAWRGRLGSIPLLVRYSAQLPVIGAFFSPDYGELYYEIYLGNHSGLAHCGWWGNHFSYDHRLTADFRFGGTSLRIGYDGRFLSSKANNLVNNVSTHSAIIGLTGEWISLNPRKPVSPQVRTITATY